MKRNRKQKPKMKQLVRFGLAPEGALKGSHHERKHMSRRTEFGVRFEEKQKLKFIYGLSEKELKRYASEASRTAGDPKEELLRRIETRLDNIVFRLGFSPSRAHARQLVAHGHVWVAGKRLSIPSAHVAVGAKVAVDERTFENAIVQETLKKSETLPQWLERKERTGSLLMLPKREEVALPVDLDTVMNLLG